MFAFTDTFDGCGRPVIPISEAGHIGASRISTCVLGNESSFLFEKKCDDGKVLGMVVFLFGREMLLLICLRIFSRPSYIHQESWPSNMNHMLVFFLI